MIMKIIYRYLNIKQCISPNILINVLSPQYARIYLLFILQLLDDIVVKTIAYTVNFREHCIAVRLYQILACLQSAQGGSYYSCIGLYARRYRRVGTVAY